MKNGTRKKKKPQIKSERFFKDLYFLCKKHDVTIVGFDDGLTFYFKHFSIQPENSSYHFGEETPKDLVELMELTKKREFCATRK